MEGLTVDTLYSNLSLSGLPSPFSFDSSPASSLYLAGHTSTTPNFSEHRVPSTPTMRALDVYEDGRSYPAQSPSWNTRPDDVFEIYEPVVSPHAFSEPPSPLFRPVPEPFSRPQRSPHSYSATQSPRFANAPSNLPLWEKLHHSPSREVYVPETSDHVQKGPRKASFSMTLEEFRVSVDAQTASSSASGKNSTQNASQFLGVDLRFHCPANNCKCSYMRKGDLKSHILKKHDNLSDVAHTISTQRSTKKGKTYPCPVDSCKCGYCRKQDLRRHFRLKHSDLAEDYPELMRPITKTKKSVHRCPLCPQHFRRDGNLRNHLRKAHHAEMDEEDRLSLLREEPGEGKDSPQTDSSSDH